MTKTPLEDMFALTWDDAKDIVKGFHSEMKKGLSSKESSLKMIPSFVHRPKGTEMGTFLALDLGGTNLRVLAAELKGKGSLKAASVAKFTVSRALMQGEGRALFDFMATCVRDFMVQNELDLKKSYEIGFTFSFPVRQTALAAGELISWTKGFCAGGVVGRDVVALLRGALKRAGLSNVKVAALLNDTVGTLAAKAYEERLCDMAVILGTGTNACYAEGSKGGMIMNIEWGNFSLLKRNRYDKVLDGGSQNKGRQFLEKAVSGMYLGELARLVFQDMIAHGLVNGGAFRERTEPYSFSTEEMSSLAAGAPIEGMDAGDLETLKDVCGLISKRAARIAGAGIAAVVSWMDKELEKEHVVGVDGSLFEKYPGFRPAITEMLGEFLDEKAARIRLETAKDGSGLGATVIAACARN